MAETKAWVPRLNEVPIHHLPVLVSSMATDTPAMVVPSPAFDEAVPVIVPVQFVT